ncbi:hypothetical protein Tco_1577185 [Tanacetum coccineum]
MTLTSQYLPGKANVVAIKEAQQGRSGVWAIMQNVEDGKHTEFSVDDDGVVWFEDRLCVPNDQEFWWNGMKTRWARLFLGFRLLVWPTTQKRHDAICVVVDRLILRDPKFTSRFRKGLQKAWGFSSYVQYIHFILKPVMVRSERTIKTLEDMLRALLEL